MSHYCNLQGTSYTGFKKFGNFPEIPLIFLSSLLRQNPFLRPTHRGRTRCATQISCGRPLDKDTAAFRDSPKSHLWLFLRGLGVRGEVWVREKGVVSA